MNNIYYVYGHICPITGLILYIGHGCKGRAWLHGSRNTCLRSQEHLDHLNQLTNLGWIPCDWVKIYHKGMSKKEACKTEREMIELHRPTYNKRQGVKNLKMTPDKVEAARKLRGEGLSYDKIGSAIGLSAMTAYRGLNGVTKNVT